MKQCQNCGFLSLRRTRDLRLVEAHQRYRDDCQVITGHGNVEYHEDPVPVCFVRAASLQQECGDKPNNDAILAVIQKDRTACPGHTPWTMGFTPKEHAEMIQELALREMQEKRETADREWRERLDARDHKWRIEEREAAEQQQKREAAWRRKELLVMGVIVTIVSVAAQIVSAFIERGDLFKLQKPEQSATATHR